MSRVNAVTPELSFLWQHACKDVVAKRGGAALMTTLGGSLSHEELLSAVVAEHSLWTDETDEELRGFCLYRARVIEGVYVAHAHRRQRVATTLVLAVLEGEDALADAYALPGDRAMKSLYESLGWKARLLTMRGA